MSTQMIIRIDPDLKAKVNNFAKMEGKSVSEIVRNLLDAYVKNRDIGAYIDSLWERTGSKLKAEGFDKKDVSKVICKLRAKS